MQAKRLQSKYAVSDENLSEQGEPAKFIQDLKEKASLVMFYEDTAYSKSLEYMFLKLGLENGHKGMYLLRDTVKNVESHAVLSGTDPTMFRNQVQVFNISGKKWEQIVRALESFTSAQKETPTRIVLQNNEFATEQQHDLIHIESILSEIYEKSNTSVLVSYNAEMLSDAGFMQQVINLHDHVVFAPTFGKGLVIKTR